MMIVTTDAVDVVLREDGWVVTLNSKDDLMVNGQVVDDFIMPHLQACVGVAFDGLLPCLIDFYIKDAAKKNTDK